MLPRSRREFIKDYIISIAVFSQPALILLQHLLVSIIGLEIEQTTIYRVVLTIVLLVPAILISFFRKPALFISVYVFVGIIFLFTIIVFPKNTPILLQDGFRFLLPVVIPSFLCIQAIRSNDAIKWSLQVVGWISALGAVLFLLFFLLGRFSIDKYSMSFSYACLFPMLVLFSQKRPLSILVSFLVFLEVLAFGSRGAAVFFIAYIALDLFRQKGKMRAIVVFGGIFLLVLFPYFVQYLDQIGVYSRSVNLILNGGFTESDGRDKIYEKALTLLGNNLITGVGIYGDRALIGGYCHNILLEIMLDFGIIIGTIIISLFSFVVINALYISRNEIREIAMVLLFCGVFPNMLSGSYLQEPNFAIFMGYCMWILNHRKVASQRAMAI